MSRGDLPILSTLPDGRAFRTRPARAASRTDGGLAAMLRSLGVLEVLGASSDPRRLPESQRVAPA